ncbi:hypothetical protein H4R99_002839 [Coemansia sp. RSA 1722]|nr:hypothetical protein H4R99_002839 [Coemansia sp. RSA 1722]
MTAKDQKSIAENEHMNTAASKGDAGVPQSEDIAEAGATKASVPSHPQAENAEGDGDGGTGTDKQAAQNVPATASDIVASEDSVEAKEDASSNNNEKPTTAVKPGGGNNQGAGEQNNSDVSDQDDFTSVDAASDALQEISLGEKSKPEVEAGSSLIGAVMVSDIGKPSPAEVATAILMKDADTARAFGARGFQGSGESDRTATSPLAGSSTSPRSQPEISELSDHGDDNADGDSEVEDAEERQRRLFRLAEKRRQHKERMSQTVVSSEEIEVMRSGLSSARECVSPVELRIINGAYPEGLRGSLYCVGPGRFEVAYNVQRELEQATRTFGFGHIMDTLPLLSKVSFDPKATSITYRSRLIAKQAASRIQMEHGINTKVPGALYMSDTNQTFLNKFIPKASHYTTPEGESCGQDIQLFMPLQGTNQTVVCTNHVGALQNIDPVDLHPRAIVELKDVNPEFKGSLSCPHMQYDSNTREHFTVLQDVAFRSTTYTVVAISESQPEGYVVASFVAQASVLHSFAVTQDYVIVPVYPYTAPIGGVSYRWSDSLLETLTFDNSRPTHFYVISREYRRVQCVYQAPAFFAMHQINAVQEMATDSLSIDLVAYENDAVLRRLMINDLRKPSADFLIPSGFARRYQLGGITMEATKFVESKGRQSLLPPAHSLLLRNEPVELARINPMVAMRPYTYLYGLGHVERLQGLPAHVASTTMYNCIVKLDVNDASKRPLVWSRKHCYPSEPVFVPHSDKEDDGFVISIFFDSMRITSCLLVLEAKTLKELMIAQLPSAVPLSFGHAKFSI